jgi:hypothetical protein
VTQWKLLEADMRAIMLAAMLAVVAPMAAPAPVTVAAERQLQQFSVAQLMQATALDLLFDQFSTAIAASARSGDISSDQIFLGHWEGAAASCFNSAALRSRLSSAFGASLSDDERAALGAFFLSPLGLKVTRLERGMAQLDMSGQSVALDRGTTLSLAADARRGAQLDDLMELMSAEISGVVAAQSMRAMLVGLAVAHQQGMIEIPWDEIDMQVRATMPDLIADDARTQRALMAYAYRGLSAAELDQYIEFLRTSPAQKLYAVAAHSVDQIIASSMSRFGDILAARMASVNI